MDLNDWLSLIVCCFCLGYLVRLIFSSPRQNIGWIIVGSAILAITLLMLYFMPSVAGLIGVILWGIFIVIPSLGFFKVNTLIYQQQYGKASQLTAWLCWLHPVDGWLQRTQILKALDLAQKGNLTKAIQILQRYSRSSYHSQVLLYLIKADWKNCLSWFNQSVPKAILLKDPVLINYYLRCLGETGNLNELLQGIDFFRSYLEKHGNKIEQNLSRMYGLAFCGQTSQVRELFKGVLSIYSKQTESFWILTSQMVADKKDTSRQHLLNLRMRQDLILSNAIEWRLCYPPVEPNLVLTQSSRTILFRLKTTVNGENTSKKVTKYTAKKPYITIFLILINLIYFGLEIKQGGSEDINILYNLGGLVPEEVENGQWWRLITANFLHYGWLHLSMNMMGLYFLGHFVELTLGRLRYLIAYLVSGIGSMSLYTLLSLKLEDSGQILVGASAAIMGLVGVLCAVFLRDWLKEKSSITARRLQMILVVIGLQFLFDWTVPEISILSHLLGLGLGFIVGGLLLIK
ncbi:Rhomboid family protein [Gloeothece citriformis PCC 7424]|uniref:Rhomboid family protein n=1 Tax=Gloeothece citriformis (strain PCC 7424) TaxID=65393 RepID=B7KFX4_GLOC7|nr:rhomboid family intramembrane serine protease [Gloeothece citriformis]ACK69167.1 Rhomboid family protein [Gloeothece citriformis PCC 7424]